MSGYTKVFGSIIHSTIWRDDDHVRLVWITMLAMAGEDGVVEASVPGLMDAARVTRGNVEDALERLMSPDPDSRNPDHEGRRIAAIDGGWLLLNHDKYKYKMSKEEKLERDRENSRIRSQRYRDKRHAIVTPVTQRHEESRENGHQTIPDHTRSDQTRIEDGSHAPAHDQRGAYNAGKITDKEAAPATHPLVALCMKLWPQWPRDQIEQSVLAWKSGRLDITDKVLQDAKASFNPREPYSRLHTWIARQAQFAARDAEKTASGPNVGRPQPEEFTPEPFVPLTDEEAAEVDRIQADYHSKHSPPEGEEG